MLERNSARTLRLHRDDNVLVAAERIEPGVPISPGLVTGQRIPFGHKVAALEIATGEPILKFGQIIGFASQPIAPGDWVHEHNVVHARLRARLPASPRRARDEASCRWRSRRRSRVFGAPTARSGTRNYIGILTSVNCSATVARFIAEAANRSGMADAFRTSTASSPFVHGTGCGMAGSGEGFDVLKRTQWGYAANPNLGAVLLVGLGCETFQIGRLKAALRHRGERDVPHHDHPGHGRHAQDDRAGPGASQGDAGRCGRRAGARRCRLPSSCWRCNAAAPTAIPASPPIPALGVAADILVRQWRHGDPFRDAGDLRRRAPAHPARQEPRGRREARRAHPLVGGLHQAQPRRDEQQSLARQQGRRPDHHPGEIAGRGGQGRHRRR